MRVWQVFVFRQFSVYFLNLLKIVVLTIFFVTYFVLVVMIKITKINFFFFVSLSFLNLSCSNRWLINHYTYTSYQIGSKDTSQTNSITTKVGPPYQEFRNENGMDIIVDAQRMRSTRNFGETIQLLDQNQDAIYPGSIVAISANEYKIKPLNDDKLPRSPLNIVVPTNSSNASLRVEKPDIRSINEAKARLIQNIDLKNTAGKLEYSEAELYDYQSAMQELGLNANWLVASIEAKFKQAKETKKNVLWVRFKQVYYSIISEGKNEPASFFLPDSADAGAVNAFIKNIGYGNPPCYVAQIDYGRTFLIQLSSSLSVDTMKSVLKGGFNENSAGLSSDLQRLGQDIQFSIVTTGGNAEDMNGLSSTTNILELKDKIQLVIDKGMNPNSPAAPVSMVLRHLSDRSAVCINSSIDYVKKDEYSPFIPKEYVLDSIEVSVQPNNRNGGNWDPGIFDFFKPNASFPDPFVVIDGIQDSASSDKISDRLNGWLRINKVVDLQKGKKYKMTFWDKDFGPDFINGNDEIGTAELSAEELLNATNGKPANVLKPIELYNKEGKLYKVKIAIHPK